MTAPRTAIIADLGPGGAQRVLVALLNAWAEAGRAVTLITLDDTPSFYPIDDRVHWVPLALTGNSRGLIQALGANFARIRALRQAIAESPAPAILSFGDTANVLALIASRGLGRRVVISERVDPRHHPLPRAWQVARRLTYPFADLVTGQTGPVTEWLGGLSKHTLCIPNPVAAQAMAIEGIPDQKSRTIAAAGRLVPQKGFDLLIEAFAALDAPDWNLVIHGEGPDREALTAKADALGLGARFSLPGNVTDLPAHLATASLFVLSSRYEGFPNVLCEAMACGLPVIAFDCPSGPADIIRPEIDGLLVKPQDVAGLTEALSRLIADASLRRALAAQAPDIVDRFGLDAILKQWDGALDGDG